VCTPVNVHLYRPTDITNVMAKRQMVIMYNTKTDDLHIADRTTYWDD